MIYFRDATPADFGLIYEIKKSSLKPYIEKIWGWDEEVQLNFHRDHFKPKQIRIIQSDQEKAIGLVCLTKDDRCLYLNNIMVCDFAQGKGIGTTIISGIIDNARSSGRRVELRVFKVNERAGKLYERLGFSTIGETDLHYQMVWT